MLRPVISNDDLPMQAPAIPDYERQRLDALRRLAILDSSAEERFDRITRMARNLFEVPISLISLVDGERQWFKSRCGLDAQETPRDISFCGHAILGEEIFVVEDATRDPRFADNPLVLGDPHIRFYAGSPLHIAGGYKVGTLCLIDRQPRQLDARTVYSSLGSEIDVVEFADQLVPAADKDIVKIYTKRVAKKFNIMLETKVTAVEARADGLYVSYEGKHAPAEPVRYDNVLVAVGRVPNGKLMDAEKAGVAVNERGFIEVDKQLRTNVAHIHAIGDIVGQPMLAHKGVHEGHVAAEVIAGKKHYFDPKVIPSIAYTEPEMAWVGLTEKEAKQQGLNFEVATFPWAASGRAIASDCSDGMTKLIFDKDSHRVIGGAIVGTNGGELLGEIGLAIEMGADAEDLALTIHAHPTLHESVGLAAEVYEGSITDLPNAKAKKKK